MWSGLQGGFGMSASLPTEANNTPWNRHTIYTMDEMNPVIARILEGMANSGFSDRDCFGMRLSLEESIVNALKHGNRGDVSKPVHIRFVLADHQVLAEIEDQGNGFNPGAIADPLAPENIERPGGRGVFLMRHYMTSVRYNARGNCVMLCKKR
jgi:serine/threonine-protein kinase RsbW